MDNFSNDADISIEKKQDQYLLTCTGAWTLQHINQVVTRINRLPDQLDKKSTLICDISAIEAFDSAGIILLLQSVKTLQQKYLCQVDIVGASSQHQRMLTIFQNKNFNHISSGSNPYSLINNIEALGRTIVLVVRDIIQFLSFTGESFSALLHDIAHPSEIRFKAIIKNIEEAGVRALPITALTAFLIGIVVAYQGAVQLQKFGANIFIVDMIGISITRELAPMVTAIVVAGRSGSSYTAQIGVMKITEEIDAMKTMNFDPFRFLVLPRMIALMIALPLLIFFADIVGIFGGMIIADIHMNLSYGEFTSRLQTVLESKHVWIGLIKGPFFAWLIAAVGCFRGFQVSNTTESIGRFTTISVVNAIFLVILCDALFSILLTELGI